MLGTWWGPGNYRFLFLRKTRLLKLKKESDGANWLIIHRFGGEFTAISPLKSIKNKLSSECRKDRVERYKYRRRLINATQHLRYEVYGRY